MSLVEAIKAVLESQKQNFPEVLSIRIELEKTNEDCYIVILSDTERYVPGTNCQAKTQVATVNCIKREKEKTNNEAIIKATSEKVLNALIDNPTLGGFCLEFQITESDPNASNLFGANVLNEIITLEAKYWRQ